MAFRYITASDVEVLVSDLAQKIALNKSIFVPTVIVAQHHSTRDWLTTQIAEKNGIAAHFLHKNHLSFLELIYLYVVGKTIKKELLKPHQMVWLIDSLLGDSNFISEFPNLEQYIGDDDLKRFTLAEKVTSLFEQYQQKKPELIYDWNYKATHTTLPDEKWQLALWGALQEIFHYDLSNSISTIERIKEGIKDSAIQEIVKSKLPHVYFFGNFDLSKPYVALLNELGKCIEIDFYRQELSPPHKETHRILKNLGQVSMRQNALFSEMETIRIETPPKKPNSLLHQLQHQIRNGETNLREKVTVDDFIIIQNCFSPNREVEVLYHYLVKQFSENPHLKMRDICVIVPNIADYAPSIHAYFTEKSFPIDFIFYDSSHKHDTSPYHALEALLNFQEDAFTSQNVLKLLSYHYIKSKYDVRDISLLERAVTLANIRHSYEGVEALETHWVSWKYGLKRLIYGFCLPPDASSFELGNDRLIPINQFEDADTFELLKLYEFVEQLQVWIEKSKEERSIEAWVKFIQDDTIRVFIDAESYEIGTFNKLLGSLQEMHFYRGDQKVSFRTLRYFLLSALSQMESAEQQGFKGVKFITPHAYLSVPAKIYAFLGLGSSTFPRKKMTLSFDLLGYDGLSINDLDKNFFLNVLALAQEKLYLSYVGQSFKDNSSIPYSGLIDELLSNIEPLLQEGAHVKKLMVKQPLHTFSSKYNGVDSNLYKYSAAASSKIDFTKPVSSVVEPLSTNEKPVVSLHDFIKFFKDSIKYYYHHVLGVYLDDRDETPNEVELFDLNHLQSWGIKSEIIKDYLAVSNDGLDRALLVKSGLLPLHNLGRRFIDKNQREISPMLAKLMPYPTMPLQSTTVAYLECNHIVLKGQLTCIYGDTLLYTTASKDKLKYQIDAFVQFAFGVLTQPGLKQIHYVNSESDIKLVSNAQAAKTFLEALIPLYVHGSKNMNYGSTEIDLHSKLFDDIHPNSFYSSDLDEFKQKLIKCSIYSEYFHKEMKQGCFNAFQNARLFLTFYHTLKQAIDEIQTTKI